MGIKEIRRSQNITQKELADAIGVDFTIISKYEKGSVKPPANRLEAMSKVLGVPIDALLTQNIDYGYSSVNPNQDILMVRNSSTSHDTFPVKQDSASHHLFDSVDVDKYVIQDNRDLTKRLISYSGGACELCGQNAPFSDSTGIPYLESHHIQWLSEGGMPVPENTVVLCPNCHKRIHLLNAQSDVEKLRETALKHKTM